MNKKSQSLLKVTIILFSIVFLLVISQSIIFGDIPGTVYLENTSISTDVRVIVTDEGFSISKWSGESSFDVDLPEAVSVSELNGVVSMEFSSFSGQMYMSEENVFQFDGILTSKPNPQFTEIILPINLTNINCYFQPALDVEHNDFVNCNATNCWKENLTEYRPEEIVNSYACYHPHKSNDKYMTGKIFHLNRIKFIDSNNDSIWGEMNITNDTWTIYLPSDWLKDAEYPVIIDPTFGTTTVGGTTSTVLHRTYADLIDPRLAGVNDTITGYYLYGTDSVGAGFLNMSVYSNSTGNGGPDDLAFVVNRLSPVFNSTPGWRNISGLSQDLTTGTYYYLAFSEDDSTASTMVVYRDTVNDGSSVDWTGDFPDPFGTNDLPDRKWSMYATFDTYPCADGMCLFDYISVLEDVRITEGEKAGDGYGTQIKWDISDLCDLTLDSIGWAKLQFYITAKSGSPDNDGTHEFVEDQTWTESDDEITLEAQSLTNSTAVSMSSTTASTYTNWTVTTMVKQACALGYDNMTIRMTDPDYVFNKIIGAVTNSTTTNIGQEKGVTPNNFQFAAREYGDYSKRPKLYVSYTETSPTVDNAPNVTLYSPEDNTNTSDINQSFTCEVVDDQLIQNTTFYMWYDNGTLYNTTVNDTTYDSSQNITFNLSDISYDDYEWNCLVYDNNSNSTWGDNNFTISIIPLDIRFNYTKMGGAKVLKNSTSYYEIYWTNYDITNISSCILDLNGTNYTGTLDATKKECLYNMTTHVENQNYTLRGYANDSSNKWDNTNESYVYFYTSEEEVDGYWMMRAPVNSTNQDSGNSYPCVYCLEDGNGQDVGVLTRKDTVREETLGYDVDEERHCGVWTQFWFDEPNISAGNIDDVYCHIWAYGKDIQTSGEIAFYDIYTSQAELEGTDKRWENGGVIVPGDQAYFDLGIYFLQDWNYEFLDNETFWNLSVHISSNDIQVLLYKDQKSFCLINSFNGAELDDNSTLDESDYDGDGLTDYEELWVTFTDPTEEDSDFDGHSDYEEHLNNKVGYDPFDWGTITKYRINGSQSKAYVKNDSSSNIEDFKSTLDREFSSKEYNDSSIYDATQAKFITSFGKLVQTNYHYNITENISTMIGVNVFWGGEFGDFTADSVVHIYNDSGGDNFNLIGRKGLTRYLSSRRLRENFEEIINSTTGMLYYRTYTNETDISKDLDVDDSEVWIIWGGSYVNILNPTGSSPINVEYPENITVNFTLIEEGVEIISGVTVNNITIGISDCELQGSATYITDHWEQNCSIPDSSGILNITIFANTSTSGILGDIEDNAVQFISKYDRSIIANVILEDQIKRIGNIGRNINEDMSISNIIQRMGGFIKLIIESFTITNIVDGITEAIRGVTQTLSIVFVLSKSLLGIRTTTDSFTISDETTQQLGYSRSTKESLSITGLVNRLLLGTRLTTQIIDVSDTTDSTKYLTKSISESFTMDNLINRFLVRIRTTTQDITINDQIDRKYITNRLTTQSFSISNLVNRVLLGIRTTTDSLTIEDNTVRQLDATRTTTQDITINDQIDRKYLANRGISESFSISNIINRLLIGSISTSQDITITSNTDETLDASRLTTDSFTLEDTASRQLGANRGITDSFSISNLISRLLLGIRTTTESLDINADVDPTLYTYRGTTQSFSISNIVGTLYEDIGNIFSRGITDSLSITSLTNRVLLGTRTPTQDITITANTDPTQYLGKSLTQSMSISNLVNRVLLGIKSVNQEIEVTNRVDGTTFLIRTNSQILNINDIVSRIFFGYKNTNQEITINNFVSRLYTDIGNIYSRLVDQSLGIDSSTNQRFGLWRGISQSISLNSIISRTTDLTLTITQVIQFFFSLLAESGDTTGPVITLVSPGNNTEDSDGTVSFIFTPTDDNNITNCSLLYSGTVYTTSTSITKSVQNTIQVVGITSGHALYSDNLRWSINCTDQYGNIGGSNTHNLDTIPAQGGGGSGTIIQNPKSINLMYPNEWQRSSKVKITAQVYNTNDEIYLPPLSGIEFNISGVNLESKTTDELKQIIWTFDVSQIAELGEQEIKINITDKRTIIETIDIEIIEKIKKEDVDTDTMFLLYTIIGIIFLLFILIILMLRRKKEKRKHL